ncbi:MAG: double zinc ribbon domain-containing protein, partial [Thermoguttaceae bacterium]|nr:double zinc ribbon domain-containing protein [Thermoguttaceae bacterium]
MKNAFNLFWRLFVSPLLDLVYPPSCMVCHAPDLEKDEALTNAVRKYQLCPTCIETIVESADNQCRRCGATLVLPGQPPQKEKPKRVTHNQPLKVNKCRHCFPEYFKYEKIVALGRYDGLLRYLVLRTKKDYSGSVTRTLTLLLLHQREKELRKFAPDLIVPVPMYLGRFLRRGICAPIQMAEILSRELKIPWHLAVKRMRRTRL